MIARTLQRRGRGGEVEDAKQSGDWRGRPSAAARKRVGGTQSRRANGIFRQSATMPLLQQLDGHLDAERGTQLDLARVSRAGCISIVIGSRRLLSPIGGLNTPSLTAADDGGARARLFVVVLHLFARRGRDALSALGTANRDSFFFLIRIPRALFESSLFAHVQVVVVVVRECATSIRTLSSCIQHFNFAYLHDSTAPMNQLLAASAARTDSNQGRSRNNSSLPTFYSFAGFFKFCPIPYAAPDFMPLPFIRSVTSICYLCYAMLSYYQVSFCFLDGYSSICFFHKNQYQHSTWTQTCMYSKNWSQ